MAASTVVSMSACMVAKLCRRKVKLRLVDILQETW